MFIGRKYNEKNHFIQIYVAFFAKIIFLWCEMEKKAFEEDRAEMPSESLINHPVSELGHTDAQIYQVGIILFRDFGAFCVITEKTKNGFH